MFDFLLRWVAKAFTWASTSFSLSVVKMLALKVFLVNLIVLVLPVALFKAYGVVVRYVLNYASTKLSESGMEGTVVQFVGLGAYLADHLLLPEALAIILSAVFISIVLRLLTLGII